GVAQRSVDHSRPPVLPSRRSMRRPAVIVALGLVFAARAGADDALHTGVVNLDRPTVVALGVQLLISGDDNHNAQVAVRYRAAGTAEWRSAMPLFRVHPESVVGRTVPEQLAGSIFDLSPGTTYEIELHATDPDGPVDQTITLAGTTIQNATRGLRFQGAGTEGNVARRLHIRDVRLGIGSKAGQRDFYLCDNVVEGRLVWPQVYSDDGGVHADDDGIHVEGNGHVV